MRRLLVPLLDAEKLRTHIVAIRERRDKEVPEMLQHAAVQHSASRQPSSHSRRGFGQSLSVRSADVDLCWRFNPSTWAHTTECVIVVPTPAGVQVKRPECRPTSASRGALHSHAQQRLCLLHSLQATGQVHFEGPTSQLWCGLINHFMEAILSGKTVYNHGTITGDIMQCPDAPCMVSGARKRKD
jgi:hypothetical protein